MDRSSCLSTKRSLWKAWLIASAISLLVASAAGAASGDLDTTFSGDGKQTTYLVANAWSSAYAIAIQPDGRIIAVGRAAQDIGIVRYTAGGALDTTFNFTGKKIVNLGGNDWGRGVAINPGNRRIVVTGDRCSNDGGICDMAVLRFNPNGSLDATFNGTGKRIDNFGGDNRSSGDVIIQPDGKILVGGYMHNLIRDDDDFAVFRYTSVGALDTTFSGDGKQAVGFSAGSDDRVEGMALRSDGKILLGGTTCTVTSNCNFALARLNANGSLDTTFNVTGKVTADFGASDEAHGLALQPDGKVVLVGTKYASTDSSYFALARFTTDGKLDTTFAGTGKKVINFSWSADPDGAEAVLVQPDGRIVVCGYVWTRYISNFALARLNPNGTLDTTFSTDGKVQLDFHYDDWCLALARQTDGKYVLAGYSGPLPPAGFALARVLP